MRQQLSEPMIMDAILLAKGDIFIAARFLDVKPKDLNFALRLSESLQAFVLSVREVKQRADFTKMTSEQFSEEVESLAQAYRHEALEVIHELATMPFENAAMAEVKLRAAERLLGPVTTRPTADGHGLVLQELNQLYQTNAPRIRSVRVAQIEYEG